MSLKKIGKWLVNNPLGLGTFSLGLGILGWYTTIWAGELQSFILPAPHEVLARFGRALSDGILLRHAWVTLKEVLGGLLIGSVLAVTFGYALAKSKVLERLLAPYVIASQAVPTVAVAPLLVIWFGPGVISKVLVCALIVFFPILINTLVGVRNVSEDLRELMRSLQATPTQTFRMLEVPAALPVLLGGLRIGATLAVIGAVVGEFVGADKGLGYLLNLARGQYDVPMVFVTIFSLALMALSLYGLVMLAELLLLRWRRPENEERIMITEVERL